MIPLEIDPSSDRTVWGSPSIFDHDTVCPGDLARGRLECEVLDRDLEWIAVTAPPRGCLTDRGASKPWRMARRTGPPMDDAAGELTGEAVVLRDGDKLAEAVGAPSASEATRARTEGR